MDTKGFGINWKGKGFLGAWVFVSFVVLMIKTVMMEIAIGSQHQQTVLFSLLLGLESGNFSLLFKWKYEHIYIYISKMEFF